MMTVHIWKGNTDVQNLITKPQFPSECEWVIGTRFEDKILTIMLLLFQDTEYFFVGRHWFHQSLGVEYHNKVAETHTYICHSELPQSSVKDQYQSTVSMTKCWSKATIAK